MPESKENNESSGSRRNWLYARSVWIPTLGWNVLLGRILNYRAWWHEVDEFVIIGALPFPRDAAKLAELGVTGVVNTCEEYQGPQAAYAKFGIEQLRVPTIDFQHPTLNSVRLGVDFIDKHAKQGGKVYVHCKAGRGRSATVVMGWLMKHHQMTPVQAQQFLSKIRRHVNQKLAQRQVVLDYYDGLSGQQNSTPKPATHPADSTTKPS